MTNTTTTSNRKMRAFKRWMKREGIDCSDALFLSIDREDAADSIAVSVKALCDLHENDVVATIPKQSCLTVKTSAARRLIKYAELGGDLALAVAIMYERSLKSQSKWFQYLQLLPPYEPIPLLWSLAEIDSLLVGTELHKIIKEDKALVYQDWKECIKPLLQDSTPFELNPYFFTIDEYFAAKSLIASRSFQIDEYHGTGMVPLADLFNHKTAAEDVHFTAVSSSSESDADDSDAKKDTDDVKDLDEDPIASESHSEMGSFDGSDLELSSTSENDPTMEMIMVQDVKAGDEVFNTYGYVGNAALLHRYGFTEPDNPFDILNIDLEIVIQWCSSVFSCRHSRRRLSLWRKLDYSGCISQNSDYFEISFDGEPEVELLVLLYVMLLPEEKYLQLDLALSGNEKMNGTLSPHFSGMEEFLCKKGSELSTKLLLTPGVCQALLSLADARENLYGPSSLEDDIRAMNECSGSTDGKLYYSLMLRISERRIIEKLRSFAGVTRTCNGTKRRKREDKT